MPGPIVAVYDLDRLDIKNSHEIRPSPWLERPAYFTGQAWNMKIISLARPDPINNEPGPA